MDGSWKYINLSQIYEYRNWEADHYNSVLEIKRLHSLISGIYKWKPDIYIGFSRALHLQWGLAKYASQSGPSYYGVFVKTAQVAEWCCLLSIDMQL
jgi:hypothetical protein